MFSFFKKKRSPQAASSTVTAPNTTITYDADLIETLIEDHQILLEHYQRVEKSARAQHFKEVRAELNQFKNLFHQHILLENVKLYVYLSRSLPADSEQCRLVSGMRREMRHIGKAVNQFIERYDVWPWNAEMEAQFIGELEQIGSALVARIQTEEEALYPLYDIPRETA
ncbi:hemerythrin domain-containing protein [Sedimenticola hydrogenitrophicus]|uniref:hemerythrin domain-containing protein n=1 Tax=Sedimenticola hydrogenitrophicus TaxID=2967975 RepID=UPI0023AE93CE|nr:hemerythrin domain-containing protein [Sedimenticola hydrogenitrophicus]